jgi:hypothetical protein
MASKTWDAVDHYFSGQGVVLLGERDTVTGMPKGFVSVGNVSDLKITVSTSVLEHKESHTGQRGTDLRLTTETKCALSMTMENFVAENLARVTRGETTKVSAGAVTAEAIKFYPGMVVALASIKISAVVVNNAGTPLVAGTDYTVNEEAGSLKFAATVTGLVEGAALTVNYTFAEQFLVDALTAGTKELFMRFEGLNTAEENSPVVVNVFKFSTDPFKELALIGDGVQSFVLEGSVLADTYRSSGSRYFNVQKLN